MGFSLATIPISVFYRTFDFSIGELKCGGCIRYEDKALKFSLNMIIPVDLALLIILLNFLENN